MVLVSRCETCQERRGQREGLPNEDAVCCRQWGTGN